MRKRVLLWVLSLEIALAVAVATVTAGSIKQGIQIQSNRNSIEMKNKVVAPSPILSYIVNTSSRRTYPIKGIPSRSSTMLVSPLYSSLKGTSRWAYPAGISNIGDSVLSKSMPTFVNKRPLTIQGNCIKNNIPSNILYAAGRRYRSSEGQVFNPTISTTSTSSDDNHGHNKFSTSSSSTTTTYEEDISYDPRRANKNNNQKQRPINNTSNENSRQLDSPSLSFKGLHSTS